MRWLAAIALGSAAHADPLPRELGVAVGGASYDESPIAWSHLAIAVSGRAYVTPRVAVDAELEYARGYCGATCWDHHYDLLGTAALTIDMLGDRSRATWYAVLGAAYLRDETTDDEFAAESSVAGVVGLGVQLALGDRIYLAPETRLVIASHGHLRTTLVLRVSL